MEGEESFRCCLSCLTRRTCGSGNPLGFLRPASDILPGLDAL